MQANDPLEFALVFGAAVLFSVLTLIDRSDYLDPDWPTYFALVIRRPIFAGVAFYLWAIEGGMGLSLSDGPNSPNAWAGVFGQLGYILAVVFFILVWFFGLLVAYTIARQGYLARRSPAPNPEPSA